MSSLGSLQNTGSSLLKLISENVDNNTPATLPKPSLYFPLAFPPGSTPSLATHAMAFSTTGTSFAATVITMTVMAIVVMTSRIFIRCSVVSSFGPDDWFIIAAMVR